MGTENHIKFYRIGDLSADDIRQHNAWIEELKNEIEYQPLRDFLDLLKEDEPSGK